MWFSVLPRCTLFTLAVALFTLSGPSTPSVMAQSQPLTEEAQVSLITILPGDPVYTFAGHSAFRIRDPKHGIDRLYNYGTFEFDDPLFIPKFTYGHLRYFLSVTSYEPTLRIYKQQGRPVIEQQLALTAPQRNALYRFLEKKAQPENRYYQYDFFFDNCSTRIRDALKRILGTQVNFSNAPAPKTSFRRLLDPYVASRPFLDLGFDLGLGLPADQIASARERMFLPEHLMQAFDEATLEVNGQEEPLITRTDTVLWISEYDAMEATVDWPVVLGVLFLVTALGWTSWQAVNEQVPSGWLDALLFASVGIGGLVICYLWFVSTYAVTDNNLNLLWTWPTHIVAATFLVKRPESRRLRIYMAATALTSAVLAAGWPFWPQDFHAAVLPFVLAMGVRAGWWAVLPSRVSTLRPANQAEPASVA